MPYNNEPSLQDLIADSIEKKKAVKVKVVKVNKKEQTKSFERVGQKKELGEEFIDRSQFRNSRPKTYDAQSELDPEFLKSLRENFGNANYSSAKKKEFKLEIPPERYEMDYADEYRQDYARESFKQTKGNNQMRKEYTYDDYDESDGYDEYDEYEEEPKKKSRKRKKKHRLLPTLLVIILILLALACGVLYFAIDKYAGLFNFMPDDQRLEISNVVSDDNVFNVLLIGTDSRDDNRNGLSDSMILVSINKKTKEIVMTSFMRDVNVQIPGYDIETWHKLNWAHSKGGAELLMDTLEFNFGIEIDYYAKVDFLSFAEIIDSIGGLDIEITDAEAVAMQDPMREQNRLLGNEYGTDYLYEAGVYHMNGNQALAYSRIRKKVGDDFARTDRQREVISLITDKVKGMSLTELDAFATEVIPNITTNMEKKTIKNLIVSMPFYIQYEKQSQRIPYGDNKESWDYASTADGSVIQIDFDVNRQFLLDTIYKK